MNLRKLWEERVKNETSEEIVYGRFIGKMMADSIKEDILEAHIGRFIQKVTDDLKIKEEMLILDAGVGPLARFTIAFASKKSRVIAIDISMGILKSAKRRLLDEKIENVFFLQADLMNLPFKEDVFDISFCIGTLYHMPDKKGVKKGINEMVRVIKDEGFAFFDLENYLNPLNWQWVIPTKIFQALRISKPPHHFYNYHSLVKTLRTLDLESLEIETEFDLHTPLFFIKPFSAIAPQIVNMWKPIGRGLSRRADKNVILRMIGTQWHIKIKKA